MAYYDNAIGKTIYDLKDEEDFQLDLLHFFSSRYGMPVEEMKQLGIDGMTERFVEHMRYQEVNEATALKDLFYVRDSKDTPEASRLAFGRLVTAWDNAEGGGTGFWKGTGDYAAALATAPSTWLGVASAGLYKAGAQLGSKGVQLATRKVLSDQIAKYGTAQAAKEGLRTSLVKGAIQGAAAEGAMAYLHESNLGKIREDAEAPGYQYDPYKFWISVGLQSAFGGATGSVARAFDVKQRNAAIDMLEGQHMARLAQDRIATTTAVGKLRSANPDSVDRITQNINSLVAGFMRRQDGKIQLDSLDQEKVALGIGLRDKLLDTEIMGEELAPGLSVNTVRKIAGASLEVLDQIEVGPNERITSAIARHLQDETIDSSFINDLKSKYGLTSEEFSYIYMAEVSDAARIMQQAGMLKKTMNNNELVGLLSDVRQLAESGASTLGDVELRRLAAKMEEPSVVMDWAKELDALRISFMTSQPATTAANLGFSVARMGVDAVERTFHNVLNTGVRGNYNPVRGSLDILKGVTWDRQDAALAAAMLDRDLPDTARRIFYDTTRVENQLGNQSRMGKVGRFVNTLNNAVDGVFKEAVFYASVNRQLADLNNPALGTSFREFARLNGSMDNLPREIAEKAVQDSLEFVFQKGYTTDPSMFGKGADLVIRGHKELPFVISSFVPFPRYIANQIEFIHDYSPLTLITPNKLFPAEEVAGETTIAGISSTRWARAATGTTAFLAAYHFRATQGGETGPLEYIDSDGNKASLERIGGPFNTHLIIADAFYRVRNDLPPPAISDTALEALEAAAGSGFTGYNQSLVMDLLDSISAGEWTDGFSEGVADVAATFTYPAAVVNDFVGQYDPDRAARPYLKDILGLQEDEFVNIFDVAEQKAALIIRATRFLPDLEFIQYTQSFDGKTDVPLYNPFNPEPSRILNPALKHLTGINTTDRPTTLQKDISVLNLNEWELYGKRQVENPTVDVLVRKYLAENLYEDWLTIREATGYEQFDPISQEQILRGFLREEFTEAETLVTAQFETLLQEKPRLATGFIRNAYAIAEKEADRPFDEIVSMFTDGEYESANDYIFEEGLDLEIGRRQQVMEWSRMAKNMIDRMPR